MPEYTTIFDLRPEYLPNLSIRRLDPVEAALRRCVRAGLTLEQAVIRISACTHEGIRKPGVEWEDDLAGNSTLSCPHGCGFDLFLPAIPDYCDEEASTAADEFANWPNKVKRIAAQVEEEGLVVEWQELAEAKT